MKRFLLFSVSILLFVFTGHAADYFWVGGTGNWSDHAAHWATESGGTTFHPQPPTSNDNVIFDANSFPDGGAVVTIDINAYCNNMDWSDAVNSPELAGVWSVSLHIHGSLTFIEEMDFSYLGDVYFESPASGTLLTSAGQQFKRNVYFQGFGGYILQDAFQQVGGQSVFLNSGSLDLNHQDFTVNIFNTNNGNIRSLFLRSSELTITSSSNSAFSFRDENLTLDAGTSTIRFITGGANLNHGSPYGDGQAFWDVIFEAETGSSTASNHGGSFNSIVFNSTGSISGGMTVNTLTFNGDGTVFSHGNNISTLYFNANATINSDGTYGHVTFSGNATINGNNVFDTIELTEGMSYTFSSGRTQLITGDLIATGTCVNPITLQSGTSGTQTSINKNSGSITIDYCSLRNISSGGGASFTANNSYDLGNNSGWTINHPTPLNLYWVGGSGNWNDNSNWSFDSGGEGGACIPSYIDNVYFNANSFDEPGQTVTITGDENNRIYCNNMNWTGVTNNPVLAGASSQILHIYGSMILSNNMEWSYTGPVIFQATDDGKNIYTAGVLINSDMRFRGQGGEWTLQSALNMAGKTLFLEGGSLITNNYPLTVNIFNSFNTNTRSLSLGTSELTITSSSNSAFYFRGDNFSFDAGTSLIRFITAGANLNHGSNWGPGLNFHDVIFEAESGSSSVSNSPGSFNTLTFNSIGSVSGGNAINTLTFHNTGTIGTNGNEIDHVVFHANATINSNGTYQNVTMLGDGTITGHNTFGTLTLSPGRQYTFTAGRTQTFLEGIIAEGTESDFITIRSNTANSHSTFYKESGEINVDYVYLRDNHATGDAVFTANNSIDLGNTDGWTIIAPPGRDFYWVGGSGNWNDTGNWTLSDTGGEGGAGVPSANDNAFFNEYSFSEEGQVVTLVGDEANNIMINNIDWTGVTNNPELAGASAQNLRIYGSLTLSPDMNYTFEGRLYFESTDTGNTIKTAGNALDNNHLYLIGVGGEWILEDALDLGPQTLFLVYGTFNTNNHDVHAGIFNSNYNANERTLILGSSVITLSSNSFYAMRFHGNGMNLDAGTSLIRFTGVGPGMYNALGGGLFFHDVVFESVSGTTDLYNLNGGFNSVEFKSLGTNRLFRSNTINTLTFHGTGEIRESGNNINMAVFNGPASMFGNNTYNEAVLHEGGTITGHNTFGSLTLTAGQSYTFTNARTQTFTGELVAEGTESEMIIIQSSSATNHATFFKETGEININYVSLRDIHATGDAIFTADNSIDLGNTAGWIINSPPGRDLYWVGGTGNWNDPANWSLSASGGDGGAAVPTAIDNVFFNEYSFTEPGQVVTLLGDASGNINFKDMDWTGATHHPEFSGASGLNMRIYGSLALSPDMEYTFAGGIYFESTNTGNTVKTEGNSLDKNHLYLSGLGGEWILEDALDIGSRTLFLVYGTLNTNNHNIHAGVFNSNYNAHERTLILGSSVITLSSTSNQAMYFNGNGMNLDAGTSLIRFTGLGPGMYNISGGGLFFHDVVFEALSGTVNAYNLNGGFNNIEFKSQGTNRLYQSNTINKIEFHGLGDIRDNCTIDHAIFNDDGFIRGNNTFGTLAFSAGHTYTITSGRTQTITGDLFADGTCASAITIQSSSATSHTTISKSSGTVTVQYCNLQGINATGEAVFVAENSIDNGNNSGWEFSFVSNDLYWVGGTGDWNDVNNWAAESGGEGGYCLPTQLDNVIFDMNSFTQGGQAVYVDVANASCRTMDWSEATNVPTFVSQSANYNLNIHGSLYLNPNMNFNFTGNVYFEGGPPEHDKGSYEINMAGKSFNNNLYFNGPGGVWTLLDNLNISNNILYLNHGTLNTNSQTINLGRFISTNNNERMLLMEESVFTLTSTSSQAWHVTGSNFGLQSAGSDIRFSNANAGLWSVADGDLTYNDVLFQNPVGTSTLRSNGYFNSIVFNPAGKIMGGCSANQVEFNAVAEIENDNLFGDVVFQNNATINGNNTFDNLYMAPGRLYQLQVNRTQIINGDLDFWGSNLSPITLQSSAEGTQATISKADGEVTGNYILLRDMNATGGATFNVYNAQDLGNNTGWNFLEPPFATCPDDMTVCENAEAFALTQALPAGGEYTGEGVYFDDVMEMYMFDPSLIDGASAVINYEIGGLFPSDCYFVIHLLHLPVADCPDDMVVCTGSGYIQLYEGLGHYSHNGQTITGINPDTPGTYNIIYSLTNECGQATCAFTIEVNPSPVLSISGNPDFCDDTYTTLTASPGYSYLWNTGETTQSIQVAETGLYSVVAVNEFDCEAGAEVQATAYPYVGDFNALLPADQTYGVEEPVVFYWETAENAIAYDLYLWRTNQSKPMHPTIAGITETSYTHSAYLNKNYMYNWQVVARNPCSSVESAVHMFSFNVFTDLIVEAIEVPHVATAGEPIEVSYIIKNTGTVNTGIIPWQDAIYISPDEVFDPASAIKLASFTNVSPLDPDQSYSNTVEVTLPYDQEGAYYLFVKTDDTNTIPETDETNNVLGSEEPIQVSFPPYPDLAVSNVQSLSGNIVPGETFTVGWHVDNIGDADAVGGWSHRIAIISGQKTRILGFVQHAETLEEGGTIAKTASFNISKHIDLEGAVYIQVRLTPNPDLVEKPNATANNTALSDEAVWLDRKITISLPHNTLDENDPSPMQAMLYRSGDRSEALDVQMSVSEENRISLPETIAIGKNQAGNTFFIHAIDNDEMEGDIDLIITAQAPFYPDAGALLTIIDDEVPSLTVSLSVYEATEGESFQMTITRDLVTDEPLDVLLSADKINKLLFPQDVSIAANEASVTIEVEVIDNSIPETDQDVVITASAVGFVPGTAIIFILDNDMPQLTLTVDPSTISEGGGPYASFGTLQLDEPLAVPVVVLISADTQGQLFFPAQVSFPAGQVQRQFNIGAINNNIVDGDRTVEITATIFLNSCNCSAPPSSGGYDTASITILDNDGYSLSVAVTPLSVPENKEDAGFINISRNTVGGPEITITISHNAEEVLDAPSSVVMPEGVTSINVPFNTLDDGVEAGDHLVTVMASAVGYAMGSNWFIIADQNLPDYVAKGIALSESSVIINEEVDINVQISNEGFVTAPTGVQVNIYRSASEQLGSSAILVETLYTGSSIPVGQTVNLSTTYTPDDAVGDFYFIATVNADGAINELLSINNTSHAAALSILPDYSATAMVDGRTVFNGTTHVPIIGTTQTLLGEPAPNKEVDVYIIINGARRVLRTVSDDQGAFSVGFMPVNGEAGAFILGACYPGLDLDDVQDEFTVLGARHTQSGFITWDITHGETKEYTLNIENRSDLDLTNLRLEVLLGPSGCVINSTPVASLPGNSNAVMNYSVTANSITMGNNYEEARLRLVSDEGTRYTFSGWYFSQAALGNLRLIPAAINKAMVSGQTNYAEFEIMNNGIDTTGIITIQIPQNNWMSFASGTNTIPSLNPGQKAVVTLKLTPGSDLQLNNPISGQIGLNATNAAGVLLPFTFEPVSLETGSLLVDVVNEYTYNTEAAPHLEGASVTLLHPASGQVIAQGTTDANGLFLAEGINEGYYNLRVTAQNHDSYNNIIYIEKGLTTNKLIFLAFQAISYSWEVVPTMIEDVYDIQLVTVFVTNVPLPVITMDLPEVFPQLNPGQQLPFIVTLTNHGLITAENVRLTFPDLEAYHFIFDADQFDILPNTSVQIPVILKGVENKSSPERSNLCGKVALAEYEFQCQGPRLRIVQKEVKFEAEICLPISFSTESVYCFGCVGGGVPVPPTQPGGPSTVAPMQIPTMPFSNSIIECDPCIEELANRLWNCSPVPRHFIVPGKEYLGSDKNKGPVLVAAVFLYKAYKKFEAVKCAADLSYALIKCGTGGGGGPGPGPGNGNGNGNGEGEGKRKLDPLRTPELALAHEYVNMAWAGFIASKEVSLEILNDAELLDSDMYGVFNEFVFDFIESETPIDDFTIAEMSDALEGTDISTWRIESFAERWNATLEAWNMGIYSPTPEHPNVVDTLKLHEHIQDYLMVQDYANEQGFASIEDLYNGAHAIINNHMSDSQGAVCASVTVQFSQTLTMTREAFEGTLTIFNGHETDAMENIGLNLVIRDEDGIIRNDLFQINTESLSQITGIDGQGSLDAQATGSAVIMFIPTRDAAPDYPKLYSFGGTLTYYDPFNEDIVEQHLFPVTLQVNPSPDLHIDYFMQRDILGNDPFTDVIEPSIPAELAVMINNKGVGTAYSVLIESAQPQIIDNEKGLLIDFEIVGSNLGGQPTSLGLLDVDFGDIQGGEIAVGQWWFTSSLLGQFVSYDVSVNHLNSFGNSRLSLISSIEIHELIKSVRVYGELDDGINDFLVNNIPDLENTPDALYYSNGHVATVHAASNAEFDGPVNLNNLVRELTVYPYASGWNYARLNDPGNGNFQIVSCTREDGQEIPLDNIWLTHVTIPGGGMPVYENKLHFVDIFDGTDPVSYTVVFEPGNLDVPQVVAINGVPPGLSDAPVTNVDLVFNKAIDPDTFTYEDMTLTCQAGPNLMDEDVVITQLSETEFNVDFTSKTSDNGFYRLVVQTTGIADLYGNYGQVGKEATWIQSVSTPAITNFLGLPDYASAPVDTLLVLFNMPIYPDTFTNEQLVLIGPDNNPIPSDDLVITAENNGNTLFRISGLIPLTQDDGTYLLNILVTEILGETGMLGVVNQSIQWTVCQVPPPAVFAGEDASICSGHVHQLSGEVEQASSFAWTTSGSGSFDDAQALDPVYTPSLEDIIAGVVHLTLTAQPMDACAHAASDAITLQIVQTIEPALSIRTTAVWICEGTPVTFTAIPVNGGLNPLYQWLVNDEEVGANSLVFTSSSLEQGDVVRVLMTSSLTCPDPETVTSNSITMHVTPMVTPEISLEASATEIVEGDTVFFAATYMHGGEWPYFEWLINEQYAAFTSNPVFESTALEDGDEVYVVLYSDLLCNTGPAMSNIIQMVVNPDTTVRCPGMVVVSIYQDAFLLDVALPEGGTYSGQGVVDNVFTPALAGEGEHIITYTYTNPETGYTNDCTFPLVVNTLPLEESVQDIIVSDEFCINAMESISIAGDGTHFIVEPGGSAEVISGKQIIIKDHTHVKASGYAIFRIESGNVFCDIPEPMVAATREAETQTAEVSFDPGISDVPDKEGISEQQLFKVYPNPTPGAFTLELYGDAGCSAIAVEIFSMVGERLWHETLPGAGRYELSLTGRQPGMYIIRVTAGGNVGFERLIKH